MINEFREMPRPPFPYTQTVAAKLRVYRVV